MKDSTVAQIYNPSYLGETDWTDCSLSQPEHKGRLS
jgi:hypothetical protein